VSRGFACIAVALLAAALVVNAGPALAGSQSTAGWILTAGHINGAFGSQFRTDVWLFNPAYPPGNAATVTLTFHRSDQDGAASPLAATVTLLPRETRYLPDVTLSTLPAGDGVVGNISWSSDLAVMVSARIYTAGTCNGVPCQYSFRVPGIPQSESLTRRADPTDTANVLQLYGLISADPNFRTNIGVTNTSGVVAPVEIAIIDPIDATVYHKETATIPPYSYHQFNDVLDPAVDPSVPPKAGLRITVAVPETADPAATVLAAAYVADNRSQDGYAFIGERQTDSISPQVLGVLPLP
jgi:hypothetical protein